MLKTAELNDAARLRMLSRRQLLWQPSKAAFIQGGGWYTGGPVSKVDLVQPYLIHTGARADRDHLNLVEVLKNSSPAELTWPLKVPIEELLPLGAPIVDFLARDSCRVDTWRLPNRAEITKIQNHRGLKHPGISGGSDGNLDVREVKLGFSKESEILEFRSWVEDRLEVQRSIFPAPFLSFDVEEIAIPESDFEKLVNAARSDKVEWIKCKNPWGRAGRSLPVKWAFGDGTSWLGIVTWPAKILRRFGQREQYSVLGCRPQAALLHLLNSFPPLVGWGIRNDVASLQDDLYILRPDIPVTLSFVEISVLGVFSGWGLDRFNMAVMAFSLVGTCLDKFSSRADGC